jgi:alpha-tubulin suppressor-like RCC1 family protein
VLYDILASTNVAASLAEYEWTWLGQGLTCNTYSFSNQPPGLSFYVLEAPAQTITLAFGDNTYGQCNVPAGLTNARSVAAGGYFSLALRADGTVTAWGDNARGETNIPPGLTNVVSIAAGYLHGLAVLTNGAVTNWGSYYDNTNYHAVTNYSTASRPPSSNVMAVAAGQEHDLALMSNGTVVAWGLTNADANWVPAGLTNVKAIACGWHFNCALLSNGVVTNWGDNYVSGWNVTAVPGDLTNAAAIAANAYDCMALRSNGTVKAWGCPAFTNAPAGLSNVVAVSEGGFGWQSLALQANGTVVAWGDTNPPFGIPPGVTGVKAISAGYSHNLLIASGLAPIIVAEPTNQYAVAGGSVTFSAQEEALAGMQYQWQFDGVNIAGATNATLTLGNVNAADAGSYQVIVSNQDGVVTSSAATFTLVLPPQIDYPDTWPPTSGLYWFQPGDWRLYTEVANDYFESQYLFGYQWHFNGTNIPGASGIEAPISYEYPAADGVYTVVITNAAGSANVTWNVTLASPGMVGAWGSDGSGECNRPLGLTNAAAIAAGDYHAVAAGDDGTVTQWGQYWDGTNFYALGSPPPFTNIVAVAAGRGHDLALTSTGVVTNWGLTNGPANFVPTKLPAVKAIAAGWNHNVALLTNGAVFAWGNNTYGQTNVPGDLTNANAAIAIAASALHSVALRVNGTVAAWGNTNGQTSPSGLTNVVAVAAGEYHCLALQSNGLVFAWGSNNLGQCNVPAGLSNVMAVAAGWGHSAALKNDDSIVEWGDNGAGQTNVPQPYPGDPSIPIKLIAAGGNHTLAAIWSPLVQYPIDVSKDLLLIYNTNSPGNGSSNVCAYYLAHRPMVAKANVLAIGCTNTEIIEPGDYATNLAGPVRNWLAANPTKRPSYVILFQDIPSRVDIASPTPSVQYELNTACATNWHPFVTSINMNGTGGTTDCIAYINKLASTGSSNTPGQVILSATGAGYGNTHWYFDDTECCYGGAALGLAAEEALLQDGVSSNSIVYTNVYPDCGSLACHITNGNNIAGYLCWGEHSSLGASYATNDSVAWTGNSGWYLMQTIESFNGQRNGGGFQGSFLQWFASDAFGGTNYSNTPVGAPSNVDEPHLPNIGYTAMYFGLWASGKNAGICAWNAINSPSFQVVGDPLVIK